LSLDNKEVVDTVISNKKSKNVYFCIEEGRPFNEIKDAPYKLQKRIWLIKNYIKSKKAKKRYGKNIKIFFACTEKPTAIIKKLLNKEKVKYGVIGTSNFTKSLV